MDFLTELDTDALAAHGLGEWPFGFADRVRFNEIDALGHVNNTAYLVWFESLRVSYIQAYGLTSYSADDPQIVVRHQTADYYAPMFQNEPYMLTGRTRLIKPSSLIMDYAVHSGSTLRASGMAVIVSLEQDGKTRRPHRQEAVQRMVEFDGAERVGFAS